MVTLPDEWRVRRTKRRDGYRAAAAEPELRVELPPPTPFMAIILASVGALAGLAALRASVETRAGPLVGVLATVALGFGVASITLLIRRPRHGMAASFAAGAVRVAREGGPSVDCGRVERLQARHAHEGQWQLAMTTARGGRQLLIDAGGTRAQVESLLREVGRHLEMGFARENGELVAHAMPGRGSVAEASDQPVEREGDTADAE